MREFTMPSLGADMDVGTLRRWRVGPGETVHRGQVVAEVETDKGVVEVEIWQDGVFGSIRVAEGTRVPVGTVLATLRDPDEAPSGSSAHTAQTVPPPSPRSIPASEAPPRPPLSSPAARQRARDLSVPLERVQGTGPRGAVTVADVERAARPLAPAPVTLAPPPDRAAAMRRAIATAMSRSKREIPHYYLSAVIDLGRALSWLADENRRRSLTDRLLPAVLLLKATALALRDAPALNGLWVDGDFRAASEIHLGVAISLRGGGLVAPAIHHADGRSVGELMHDLADLTARARGGSLRSSELTDATVTVSSLGERGVEMVFGVIHPPQVALVGFGGIADRPWAADGLLGVRPVVTLGLAADHRASDGHQGARFLARVSDLLQTPEAL